MKPAHFIHLNKIVLLTSFLLVCIGALFIYASSAFKADYAFSDSLFYVKKHVAFSFLSFLFAFFLQYIPIHWLKKMTFYLCFFALFLLALIFIPGIYKKIGGAYRWIYFGLFHFQPSELSKAAVIFFFSYFLSLKKSTHKEAVTFFVFGIFFLFCGLILLQPDFGTFVLLLSIVFILFWVRGLNSSYMYLLSVFSVVSLILLILQKPYRLKRIVAFLNPFDHGQDSGFQIIQSYMALYNGGWFGLGLGESKQKLFYLPEAHTDFIISVIGEELGFVGMFAVLGLCFFLVHLGLSIARALDDYFLRFLALGISALIGVQSFFNIAVATGLLPTKGIPLPFVSSGLSSLFIFISLSGVLARLGLEVYENSARSS